MQVLMMAIELSFHDLIDFSSTCSIMAFSNLFVELCLMTVMTDFYNWNRVKLRYCDGASFAGNSRFDNEVNFFYTFSTMSLHFSSTSINCFSISSNQQFNFVDLLYFVLTMSRPRCFTLEDKRFGRQLFLIFFPKGCHWQRR